MKHLDADAFDADYYRRFYRDPATRVIDAKATARLARFVRSYIDLLEAEVHTALDLGCGLGWWRDAIESWRPRCSYTGVEFSDYLVEKCGWDKGSVVDYRAKRPADLVICQGVLQYLPNSAARAALGNLVELTGSILYLEALTTEDWRENCDNDRTDGDVHLRTGGWYRRQLRPTFYNCGGGVFVRRDADVALFELERLD